MATEVSVSFPPKRIISLVPSQTELLADLGLGDEVVGITKFCNHPDAWKSKIRVGGTKQFNHEVIDQLMPDLIIGNKEENYRDGIESLRKKYPVWMSDISTLDEALAMIRSVGRLVDRQEAGDHLSTRIVEAFAGMPKGISRRVLYLVWKRPWMAAGQDTFINSMITQLGSSNAVRLERYPELSSETIAQLNPDVVMLSSEPFPFKQAHIDELKTLCPQADVMLVDGEMFSWYGSRLLLAPNYFKSLNL